MESQQLGRSVHMHDQATARVRVLEDERNILESQVHKLETELSAMEVSRDNLRKDKANFVGFLERLSRTLNLDELTQDVGIELHMDSILHRAEQLARLESDKIVDKVTQISMDTNPKSQQQAERSAEQQPAPSPSAQGFTPARPVMLFLEQNTLLAAQFERAYSLRTVRDLSIKVDNITRVFEATYRALEYQLEGFIVPPISAEDFVRVCRTLTLMRIQNVMEARTLIRQPSSIRLVGHFNIPQPIGDLLYALGDYYSEMDSYQYNICHTPEPTESPPSYFSVDPDLISTFFRFISLCENHYRMVPFPRPTDVIGRPLFCLTKSENNDEGQVRSAYMVATPNDVLLRFIHEDLYHGDAYFSYDDCNFIRSDPLNITYIITEYVRSYIIN